MTNSTGIRRLAAAIAVLGLVLAPARPVRATPADPDTLRLATAIALAREQNPMLHAMALRADAAAERIPQAGALPDPMLSFALSNWTIDGLAPSEPMSMNMVQFTQRFPWPGKLARGEDRARHLAQAERLDADEAELQLVARVKSVYFRLAYMDRALITMRQTRDLLRNFLEVASAMYAVGTGLQQDVLQAQVAVARMTEDITVMEQNRLAMAARLNALLGREATAAVGALELPATVDEPLPIDSLMSLAVAHRPALGAAAERASAAHSGYRAARRMLYPDLTVTLGYGQRPDFNDMASLMVGFSLPIWAGSRQLPLRREMQAMQAAEEARAVDLYNETFARLGELRAEAVRARNLSGLYTNAVLPQARAAVESALAAYRVGSVNYMTLVESQMTVNRYEIQSVQLAADYHRAVSEIEALVGGDIGGR